MCFSARADHSALRLPSDDDAPARVTTRRGERSEGSSPSQPFGTPMTDRQWPGRRHGLGGAYAVSVSTRNFR